MKKDKVYLFYIDSKPTIIKSKFTVYNNNIRQTLFSSNHIDKKEFTDIDDEYDNVLTYVKYLRDKYISKQGILVTKNITFPLIIDRYTIIDGKCRSYLLDGTPVVTNSRWYSKVVDPNNINNLSGQEVAYIYKEYIKLKDKLNTLSNILKSEINEM